MNTDSSVQTVPLTSHRRHKVIKKKSERKEEREVGWKEEQRKKPVGRKIMDHLMQLCLKT